MPLFVPETTSGGGGNITFSAGTSSGSLSSLVFNNSNGVSFGLSGSTLTASAAGGGGGGVTPALSGSNGSFSYSTATFGNLNGVSFYTSNGSMVASHNALTTAAQSNHSHGNPTLNLTNLSGTTNSNSAGLTLSLSAAAPVALTSWTVSDSATSGTVGRLAFTNLNGVTLSLSSGTGGLHTIVGSHNALTTAALSDHSHGNPTLNLTNLSGTTASNSAGFTLSLSAAAAGGGGAAIVLSQRELFPLITGTGASSHAPASWWFNPMSLDQPLTFSNIMVLKSFSLAAHFSTSTSGSGNQRHSYSHGITIFRREGTGTNSTRLTTVTTASFGLSLSMSWTSRSNTMTLSWVTNTTGGTSSFTTTSSASNFMLFLQSNRFIAIPCQTSLSEGLYFIAHRHSSTSALTGLSHTFNLSNVHLEPRSLTFKRLGISITDQSFSSNPTFGIGFGIASAVTTTSTMPASVISANTRQYWYANFVNQAWET